MAFGGVALKSASLFLRFIEFCCAAVIIGIFSYYLATLHNHHLPISNHLRAVEGISGAGVLYTAAALLLVCCLGGIAFFSAIGMLLDFCFTGAFAYVAWVNRGATHGSCGGTVNTPFGSGNTKIDNTVDSGHSGFTTLPSLRTACRLQKAAFAVAIIGCVFFFLSIFLEFLLIKHHRKERAFGPSPNNGYTAGSPKRNFWQRKPKHNTTDTEAHGDKLPVHSTPADIRASYAPTESTAVGGEVPVNKYGNATAMPPVAPHHAHATTGAGVVEHGVIGNGVSHDGYVRTHQPYNQNPTGTF